MSSKYPRQECDDELRDMGMRTLTEIDKYRDTIGWVPYEEYMDYIYHHCAGRQFEEWSLNDRSINNYETDMLLREVAYKNGVKYRPARDSEWSEEDQKILEEKLYTMFKEVINCYA